MNSTNAPPNTPPNPGAPEPALSLSKGLASETWVSTKLSDDQLRRAFRAHAATLSDAHTPPPAAAILFRAERRRRRAAIERAERPLLIMQTLGTFSAIAAAAWLLYPFAPRTLPTLNTTTLALAVACTALVLAGCWAMLHASSRPSA
jgi:hypothetical protein